MNEVENLELNQDDSAMDEGENLGLSCDGNDEDEGGTKTFDHNFRMFVNDRERQRRMEAI